MLQRSMRTSFHPRAGGAVALLATILSVSGCATKGDLRNVRNEIRGLSARQDSVLVALQRQARMTQDSLRGTTDQLFQIRGSVSNQLTRILEELEAIRELSGQNQRQIAGIRDQLEGLRRQALVGAFPQGDPAVGEGRPVAGGGGVTGSAPMELYNAAVTHYNRGSYNAARLAFEQFLATYPGDQDLAPEARFKLADILAQEGRLEEAVRAFERIPALHPGAPKVPWAHYRIGLLQLELDNRDEARRQFDIVVNSYPDSEVTQMARDKLREIGG